MFAVPPGYSGLRERVQGGGCSRCTRVKGVDAESCAFRDGTLLVADPYLPARSLTVTVFLLGFEETCLSCRAGDETDVNVWLAIARNVALR